MRIVLLDRDGVLNVHRKKNVLSLQDLVIEPAAATAVARLNHAGITIAVCTNQACIGRGELSWSGLEEIHAAIARAVGDAGGTIDRWFVCPHRPDERCGCRKPSPGLLRQAKAAYGFDPRTTWFVGDSVSDVDAARAAGCLAGLVMTGIGSAAARASRMDVPVFSDLSGFADHLLKAET